MKKILSSKDFYNLLASDYDEMISFPSAISARKKLLQKFLTAETKFAADIGCGSGVDAIVLALLGLKVTAFDPSDEILKKARENIKKEKVEITLHNFSIEEIPAQFNEQFDFLVSLGNTFANIPGEKLFNSLQKCFKLLKPKGRLLIQVLNYEKILADKQRIVSITMGKTKYFLRFYDFFEEHIVFNILTFNKENPSNNRLTSTKIYPHIRKNFLSGLKTAGFNSVSVYSNLDLAEFSNTQSKDLIILAGKN